MLSFLFILIIIAALCTSYYFTNKMSAQRKQILLLKYQNDSLKQISKTSENKNITVEYILPQCNEGVIKKKCELFISPMINSLVLTLLPEGSLLQIQDSAHIYNELWYEVSLITEERINTKGWIKEKFIELREDINE